MKKGYFDLVYFLILVAYGIYSWVERSMAYREAVVVADRLQSDLEQGMISGINLEKAISDAETLNRFLHGDIGVFFIVLYVFVTLSAFFLLSKTSVWSAFVLWFARVWTWRP